MNKFIKGVVVVAAAAVATVSIAACSSSGSSSSDKKPVATIASLSGESTSVKLDAGFTGALTSLGLTPGVLGTATLTDGSVHFPITGGHVTVYKKGAGRPLRSRRRAAQRQRPLADRRLDSRRSAELRHQPRQLPAVRRRLGQRHRRGQARLPVQPRRQHPGADHDHERRRDADRDPGPRFGHRRWRCSTRRSTRPRSRAAFSWESPPSWPSNQHHAAILGRSAHHTGCADRPRRIHPAPNRMCGEINCQTR